MAKLTKLELKLKEAGDKAWVTRRANLKNSAPTATTRPVSTADSITKGLRKRVVTTQTVVEKIKNAARMDYYGGTDRSVLVLYTK
jgi:hypothetical protein